MCAVTHTLNADSVAVLWAGWAGGGSRGWEGPWAGSWGSRPQEVASLLTAAVPTQHPVSAPPAGWSGKTCCPAMALQPLSTAYLLCPALTRGGQGDGAGR